MERNRLEKIARLYYLDNLNQKAIARKLNISVASVSRAITRARELEIVQITIQSDGTHYHQREYEIEQRYGIRECVITTSSENNESTFGAFAHALGDVLTRVLPRRGVLGVSWGETLKSLGEQLDNLSTIEADVIPVIGAMGTIETGIYPNSIAGTIASRLGGNAYLVNAPAVLDSADTADRIRRDRNFEQVRELWDRLDVAILGASGMETDTSVYREGIFSASELATMRAGGAVAATNFLLIGEDGTVLDQALTHRIVCLPEKSMRSIPNVIVVAAGAHKTTALRAILKSGLVDILITDVNCAAGL